MITMQELGIQQMYLRDKLSLHGIAKSTRLSRNAVRRRAQVLQAERHGNQHGPQAARGPG
jgi:predicted DNA-binding protein YlxM (UPF0122 family)